MTIRPRVLRSKAVLAGAALLALGAFRGADGEAQDDGPEEIHARVLDYLERHGDRGRIDPEAQLRRVAAEYARFRRVSALSRGRTASADWTPLGPTNGAGRMTAIASAPRSPNVVYAGAAGGGVWKTSDGGRTWRSLTDGLHDLSVGALAVAPSNPSVVYLGSGEGGYDGDFVPGIGLLKSTDGGETWALPGSVLSPIFYRILVHPANADELVVGTGAGGFRSVDGGATWTSVISHADYGDVADLVRDPADANVLYAVTFCPRGGCTHRSAHVLRSADGGVTWSDRSAGLPSTEVGPDERTSIAIAPQNPQILYAARGLRDLFDTGSLLAHIYKTTDAGMTWTDLTSVPNGYFGDQSYYDNAIVVSPNDPNVVISGGVGYVRTGDGGSAFSQAFAGSVVHPDCHDLRYIGATLWIANDGGIWTSDDDGKTATSHNDGLVTRQFYTLASDPSRPERLVGGTQDNGTLQRLDAGTAWRSLEGGDGIGCAIHPLSPEIAWMSFQGGSIERTSAAGAANPRVVSVKPPFDDDERVPFLTIVLLDPREPQTLYTGSWRLWKSRDLGETWQPLPVTTVDGSSWSSKDTIRAIAVPAAGSPVVLVAKGTGVVFRSGDGGQTWSAVLGLPAQVVTHLEIDPRDPSIAYACLATTSGPSLYKSADGGRTWTPSASGLPAFAAQVLRVDPTDSRILYCGTDVGVFRSTDAGASWSRVGAALPSSSVHDILISADGALLRVATHGRGVWEMALSEPPSPSATVAIQAPGGPISVASGTSVLFAGSAADPDPTDDAVVEWFFPDDGTVAVVEPDSAGVRHTFYRGGVFPVALTAVSRRGTRACATVEVSVREPADSCATPQVVPGSGPFPYTVSWNDIAGQTESTDPDSPCHAGQGRSGSTWFEFTPAASGTYELSTCTDVNTAISLFTGAACGPYTPLPQACPPIGGLGECGFGTTSLTAALQANQTVRVLLGGIVDENVGPVRMTISLAADPRAVEVDRVGRSHGPSGGGTLVVIEGAGFVDGASVSFGGTAAAEVSVLTSQVLIARTPPHDVGPVDVVVSVPGVGAGALGSGFRYETAASAPRSAPERPVGDRPTRTIPPR